jgi:GT2 family glycosyltransferase
MRSVILAPTAPRAPIMAAIDLIRDELSRFRLPELDTAPFEVDLGGSFSAADESVIQTWNSTDDPAALLAQPCTFLQGDWLHLDTYHLSLFLDALRDHSNLSSVGFRIRGCGRFRVIIKAVSSRGSQVLRETVVEGGRTLKSFEGEDRSTAANNIDEWERQGNLADLQGSWFGVKVMKPGYRLTASIECLSDVGVLADFRWLGRTASKQVNLGQRIYLFRTYGNPDLVAKTLELLHERVSNDHQWKHFVQRSLFIVYDATGKDQADLFSPSASGLRVLYTQGGNYGGGGNASFLAEMVKRAGEGLNTIDEVIIIDDDAGIDPETILRHDGYVTLRNANTFASSIVFARENPLCIQEWGGYWGQFFNELSDRPTQPSIQKNQHKLYPYLVRHGQNIKDPAHLNNLGQSLDVDFSTFIFISFPFAALEKIGGVLPVFLRNDDVDLSLRLKQHGYKLVINSNLFAYHDSGHSLSGEFFATFHGLIVNSTYFGLSLESVQRYFSRRLASAIATRNVLLLTVYSEVLKAFRQGPQFMEPKEVYGRYKRMMGSLGKLQKDVLRPVPDEIVQELRDKDLVDVRTLLDPLAPAPTSQRGDVVFADRSRNGFFALEQDYIEREMTTVIASAFDSLATISREFESLAKSWKAWVTSFNAYDFWNQESEGFSIVNASFRSRQQLQRPSDASVNSSLHGTTADATYNLRRLHHDRVLNQILASKPAVSVQPPAAAAVHTAALITAGAAKTPHESPSIGKRERFLRQLLGTKKTSKSNALNGQSSLAVLNTEPLPYGFDPERYLRLNPDVKASGVDPVTHYLRHGRFEQRQY